MPIIGENLILASTQPNFSRDKVKSISDLKNVKVKHYDVGHIVYCSEDNRHYVFRGDKVSYDEIYGYFRVFCEALENEEIDDLLNSLNITPIYPPKEPENLDDENAFVESVKNGGYIEIVDNLNLPIEVIIDNPTTIGLNDKNITGVIKVIESGDLTIKGNGSVNTNNIIIDGGSISIDGGAYYSDNNLFEIINDGKVRIFNGEFHPSKQLFNIDDSLSTEIVIYGGVFYDINPSMWLLEGYNAVMEEENKWVVYKATSEENK